MMSTSTSRRVRRRHRRAACSAARAGDARPLPRAQPARDAAPSTAAASRCQISTPRSPARRRPRAVADRRVERAVGRRRRRAVADERQVSALRLGVRHGAGGARAHRRVDGVARAVEPRRSAAVLPVLPPLTHTPAPRRTRGARPRRSGTRATSRRCVAASVGGQHERATETSEPASSSASAPAHGGDAQGVPHHRRRGRNVSTLFPRRSSRLLELVRANENRRRQWAGNFFGGNIGRFDGSGDGMF